MSCVLRPDPFTIESLEDIGVGGSPATTRIITAGLLLSKTKTKKKKKIKEGWKK